MHSWQLQEAKTHFSQVVREALQHGPQDITVRGEPAVVLISREEYEKLQRPKQSFVEFMRQSPFVGLELDFPRDKSLPRDIDL